MKRLLIALLLAAVAGIGWAPAASAEKVLRVAVPSNLNTLDAHKTKAGEEYLINWLVYNSLVALDRNMKNFGSFLERTNTPYLIFMVDNTSIPIDIVKFVDAGWRVLRFAGEGQPGRSQFYGKEGFTKPIRKRKIARGPFNTLSPK